MAQEDECFHSTKRLQECDVIELEVLSQMARKNANAMFALSTESKPI